MAYVNNKLTPALAGFRTSRDPHGKKAPGDRPVSRRLFIFHLPMGQITWCSFNSFSMSVPMALARAL